MGFGGRVFFGHIDTNMVGEMMEACFHSGVREVLQLRNRIGDNCFYDINFETLVKDIPWIVSDIKKHFGLTAGKQKKWSGNFPINHIRINPVNIAIARSSVVWTRGK